MQCYNTMIFNFEIIKEEVRENKRWGRNKEIETISDESSKEKKKIEAWICLFLECFSLDFIKLNKNIFFILIIKV